MIVGIVLFAFAMKPVIGNVGDELDSAASFALCGGSALYLLTVSAVRMRIEPGMTSGIPLAVSLLLLLAIAFAATIPAFAALALVTAVWLGLHTYELVSWRQAHASSRTALASP